MIKSCPSYLHSSFALQGGESLNPELFWSSPHMTSFLTDQQAKYISVSDVQTLSYNSLVSCNFFFIFKLPSKYSGDWCRIGLIYMPPIHITEGSYFGTLEMCIYTGKKWIISVMIAKKWDAGLMNDSWDTQWAEVSAQGIENKSQQSQFIRMGSASHSLSVRVPPLEDGLGKQTPSN